MEPWTQGFKTKQQTLRMLSMPMATAFLSPATPPKPPTPPHLPTPPTPPPLWAVTDSHAPSPAPALPPSPLGRPGILLPWCSWLRELRVLIYVCIYISTYYMWVHITLYIGTGDLTLYKCLSASNLQVLDLYGVREQPYTGQGSELPYTVYGS
jgi:hypothetical protein